MNTSSRLDQQSVARGSSLAVKGRPFPLDLLVYSTMQRAFSGVGPPDGVWERIKRSLSDSGQISHAGLELAERKR